MVIIFSTKKFTAIAVCISAIVTVNYFGATKVQASDLINPLDELHSLPVVGATTDILKQLNTDNNNITNLIGDTFNVVTDEDNTEEFDIADLLDNQFNNGSEEDANDQTKNSVTAGVVKVINKQLELHTSEIIEQLMIDKVELLRAEVTIVATGEKTDKEVAMKSAMSANSAENEKEKYKAQYNAQGVNFSSSSDILLESAVIDPTYHGCPLNMSPEDRALAERLVQGEAGGQGFVGAALVAQSIHDNWIEGNFNSMRALISQKGYTGSTSCPPNDDVRRACAYIFDQGNMALQHKIFYFYAYGKVSSSFHESRPFLTQFGGHRFFG